MHSSLAERSITFEHPELPEVDLRHFRTLTDDTGIIQHAMYTIPDRNHGYCVDDNARALIVSCRNRTYGEDTTGLSSTYLSFLHHAFNAQHGRFRNFMSYDRRWLEDVGSEDSHGRAMWGLGAACKAYLGSGYQRLAAELIDQAAHAVESFSSPRAWAYTLLGLDEFLSVSATHEYINDLFGYLSLRLQEQFNGCRSDDWEWCEDILSYSNAILPYAILVAGQRLQDNDMISVGLRSLRWLLERQTAPEGHLSLIGNDGWMTREGHHAQFDQQPVDAMGLVLATLRAHAVTGDDVWAAEATKCFHWFLGRNDCNASLADERTGGCRDGLHSSGVNENQGAESTLAWLIALQAMHIQMPSRRPAFQTAQGSEGLSHRTGLRAFVRTNGNGQSRH